jgi:hypothetical protein
VYAPDQGSTFEEWFTGELGNLTPNFTMRKDTEMLAACFDAIDNSTQDRQQLPRGIRLSPKATVPP